MHFIWAFVCSKRLFIFAMESGAREEAQETSPSSLSQLAFSWVTPLISLGSRRQLQHEDLMALPMQLEPRHCRSLMWQQWHQVWFFQALRFL